MSRGVHRGILKSSYYDDREKFLSKLISKIKRLNLICTELTKYSPWSNNFNIIIQLQNGLKFK